MIALPKSWLLAPELSGKKIKLSIKGTKVLPTFKGGQFENQVASFVAVEERNVVKIRLPLRSNVLSIPCEFVQPWHPSSVGERVVIIRGDMVGADYVVCKVCGDDILLADAGAPKVGLLTKPKRFLGVISRL